MQAFFLGRPCRCARCIPRRLAWLPCSRRAHRGAASGVPCESKRARRARCTWGRCSTRLRGPTAAASVVLRRRGSSCSSSWCRPCKPLPPCHGFRVVQVRGRTARRSISWMGQGWRGAPTPALARARTPHTPTASTCGRRFRWCTTLARQALRAAMPGAVVGRQRAAHVFHCAGTSIRAGAWQQLGSTMQSL